MNKSWYRHGEEVPSRMFALGAFSGLLAGPWGIWFFFIWAYAGSDAYVNIAVLVVGPAIATIAIFARRLLVASALYLIVAAAELLRPLTDMRPLDTYASWDNLVLAPDGVGVASAELLPRYDFLVSQDHDGDGVVEGEDNCPGVYNPKDPSLGYQWDSDYDKWGDACDPDSDGDGLRESSASHSGTSVDSFPLDTDNDGLRNHLDPDDDDDGAPDLLDNCTIHPNPSQANLDGDVLGDACDGDRDGGGLPDGMELSLGLDPTNPADDHLESVSPGL